jgi:glycerophosphoryl diester phosphodiesterase
VVGHRGSPREAPENTLASFLAAARAGAQAVELDARLTRDGVVVVHHDAELGRTVAGEGLVEDMAYADLADLDAGSWFAPAFSKERVPTLAQVFAALPPDVLVDVEIKPDAGNAADLPAAVLQVVRDAGALERALVTSFDPDLAQAYARLSGRPAGAILPFPPEPGDLDAWPDLAFLALAQDAVEEISLSMARQRGRTILAWTVNGVEEARSLLEKGVASIVTDRPGPLREGLGREDASGSGGRGASGG